MKQAVTDPFPTKIDVRRSRRRSAQLTLEEGRFVARVPASLTGERLDKMLAQLRAQLWDRLRRESVWSELDLIALGSVVASDHLADVDLPPWTARFSRRQHKRWGSCTFDGKTGRIRLSAHLIGHPRWLIAQVMLHELIHLVVHDHGPLFHALMARSPDHERGQGYLEALEAVERHGGPGFSLSCVIEEDEDIQPALFSVERSG